MTLGLDLCLSLSALRKLANAEALALESLIRASAAALSSALARASKRKAQASALTQASVLAVT